MVQRIGRVAGQFNSAPVNNQADVMYFGASPEQKPESQLQEEFATRTGIWCSRPARECFEWLMADHGFVKTELESAWRHRMIVWSDGRLKSNATSLDHFVGGFLIVAMFLPVVQALLISDLGQKIPIALSALMPAVLIAVWIDRTLFYPNRVARRAIALIDEWFADNKNKKGDRDDSVQGPARTAGSRVS